MLKMNIKRTGLRMDRTPGGTARGREVHVGLGGGGGSLSGR